MPTVNIHSRTGLCAHAMLTLLSQSAVQTMTMMMITDVE